MLTSARLYTNHFVCFQLFHYFLVFFPFELTNTQLQALDQIQQWGWNAA